MFLANPLKLLLLTAHFNVPARQRVLHLLLVDNLSFQGKQRANAFYTRELYQIRTMAKILYFARNQNYYQNAREMGKFVAIESVNAGKCVGKLKDIVMLATEQTEIK